jgi:hypothetical protein
MEDLQAKAGASGLLFFLEVQFGYPFIDKQIDNISCLIKSEVKKRALSMLAKAQKAAVERLLVAKEQQCAAKLQAKEKEFAEALEQAAVGAAGNSELHVALEQQRIKFVAEHEEKLLRAQEAAQANCDMVTQSLDSELDILRAAMDDLRRKHKGELSAAQSSSRSSEGSSNEGVEQALREQAQKHEEELRRKEVEHDETMAVALETKEEVLKMHQKEFDSMSKRMVKKMDGIRAETKAQMEKERKKLQQQVLKERADTAETLKTERGEMERRFKEAVDSKAKQHAEELEKVRAGVGQPESSSTGSSADATEMALQAKVHAAELVEAKVAAKREVAHTLKQERGEMERRFKEAVDSKAKQHAEELEKVRAGVGQPEERKDPGWEGHEVTYTAADGTSEQVMKLHLDAKEREHLAVAQAILDAKEKENTAALVLALTLKQKEVGAIVTAAVGEAVDAERKKKTAAIAKGVQKALALMPRAKARRKKEKKEKVAVAEEGAEPVERAERIDTDDVRDGDKSEGWSDSDGGEEGEEGEETYDTVYEAEDYESELRAAHEQELQTKVGQLQLALFQALTQQQQSYSTLQLLSGCSF